MTQLLVLAACSKIEIVPALLELHRFGLDVSDRKAKAAWVFQTQTCNGFNYNDDLEKKIHKVLNRGSLHAT